MRRPALVLLSACLAAVALSCRGKGDRQIPAGPAAAPAAFDPDRPAAALELTPDTVAARAGSFAWEATATWSVGRGVGSPTVNTTERHRLVQLASGDFEVESVLDPGRGPEAETGRAVVFAGGTTYGRSRYGEFRERSTDLGAGARRFRDDSFGLAADLARLSRGALRLDPAGEARLLGRAARRYTVSLDAARTPTPAAPAGRSGDPDTKARLELLEGATPVSAAGAVTLDAESGLPLAVQLQVTYGLASDPQLRAEVALDARVTALGGAVPTVRAPKGALADERKPAGPARALEAAGLRERGRPAPEEREAPEEEPAE